MKAHRIAVLGLLTAGLSACGDTYRASVWDAEVMFRHHRDAYQIVVDRVMEAPTEDHRGYERGDRIFDGIPLSAGFETVSFSDDGNTRSVRIGLYSYGMAVSGRIVGLAYYVEGDPAGESGADVRVFEDCQALEAAYESDELIRVGYCRLAENWFAFRYSF
ncbi:MULTISPECIES: hypothetical protein [Hyphobacterium]|uniref:Lipoprotein n=1 Tax=Hyphobacterium vulgare TaxID=1736751 RepID=A0ABV6ZXJ5_9PROT